MHPRERLLGMARLLKDRGEPIPLDMLVAADQLGLCLKEFDQPQSTTQADMEGEISHGATEEDEL